MRTSENFNSTQFANKPVLSDISLADDKYWVHRVERWIRKGGRQDEVALHSQQGNERPYPSLSSAAHRGQRLPRGRPGCVCGPRWGRYGPADRRERSAHGGGRGTSHARAIEQAEATPGARVCLKGLRARPWGDGGQRGSRRWQMGGTPRRSEACCRGRQGAHLLGSFPGSRVVGTPNF